MHKQLKIILLITCVAGLFAAGAFTARTIRPAAAQGILQPANTFLSNYSLSWFTPLTTSSGGTMISAHYGLEFSLGQTTIGKASSANTKASLGYWAGLADLFRLSMPILTR